MTIDERDYHSYQLPEEEKERRLQAIRERFETETKSHRRANRPSAIPFVLLALVSVYVVAYFLSENTKKAVSDRPVITMPFVQQQKAEPRQAEDAKPSSMTTGETKLAIIKEDYWREVFSPAAECRHPKTALKELECRNQADTARQQFERQ